MKFQSLRQARSRGAGQRGLPNPHGGPSGEPQNLGYPPQSGKSSNFRGLCGLGLKTGG